MLENYILLGTLGFHSIEDIKRKQITLMITLFSAVLGLMCHIVYQNQSIYSMLAGVASGILVLTFGILSGGKIGMGDGVILMLTGLYLGAEKNMALMMVSFALAAAWAGIAIVVLHHDKKDRIPFVPFLFLAYLIIMLV